MTTDTKSNLLSQVSSAIQNNFAPLWKTIKPIGKYAIPALLVGSAFCPLLISWLPSLAGFQSAEFISKIIPDFAGKKVRAFFEGYMTDLLPTGKKPEPADLSKQVQDKMTADPDFRKEMLTLLAQVMPSQIDASGLSEADAKQMQADLQAMSADLAAMLTEMRANNTLTQDKLDDLATALQRIEEQVGKQIIVQAQQAHIYLAADSMVVMDQHKMYDVAGLPNPYLGLEAYTYAQRDIYAGRERAANAAAEKLTSPANPLPLLFLTGSSGSGKSSFAQAGLLPRAEDFYVQRGQNCRHAVIRPGASPGYALADALAQLGLSSELAGDILPQIATPDAFSQFLATHTPSGSVNFIILDQFEELFSQAQPQQRDSVLAILEQLALFAKSHTHIICTMRVEYLPALFQYKGLYDIAKHGVDLRAMGREELKAAMQKPVQKHYRDKMVEPSLADRLAEDAAQDAGYLPLLQMTLEQLWQDGSLTLKQYIGKYREMGYALRSRAEDVFTYSDYDAAKSEPRPVADQQAIMDIFLDLILVSQLDDQVLEVRCTRERSELAKGSTQRDALIDDLVHSRLLSTSTDPQSGAVRVDIIHESLIRNWQRLAEVIKEQEEVLARRVRFEQALAEWQAHGRKDAYLLTGVRLAEGREMQAAGDVAVQNKAGRELVERSIARQEAQRRSQLRRVQIAAAVLAVLLVLAIGAGVFALFKQQEAVQQRNVAAAQALAFAAQSQKQAAPETSLLLATEALTRLDDPVTEQTMYAALGGSWQPTVMQVNTATSSLAYRADGQQLAVGAADGVVHIYDAKGNPLRTISLGANVEQLAYTPDGGLIAAGSDGRVQRFGADGQPQVSFTGYISAVNSLVLSTDGNRLLTAADQSVRLWDAHSGKNLATLELSATVKNADLAADGRILIASGTQAQLWGADGKLSATLYHTMTGTTTDQAVELPLALARFSPDGKLILTADYLNSARLWDADGKLLLTLKDGGVILDARFSPDGKLVATADAAANTYIWDVATGLRVATLRGHTGIVQGVRFSPDSSLVLTWASDNTARIWATDGTPLAVLSGHTDAVTAAIFSLDGAQVATASADHSARLWQEGSVGAVTQMRGHTNTIFAASYSKDGHYAVTGGLDGTTRLWNANGQRMLTLSNTVTIQAGERSVDILMPVYDAQISADSSRIITAGADGTVRVYDRSGARLAVFGGYNSSTLSPAQAQGLITGNYVNRISSASFSPDGKYIATNWLDDNTARLWSVDGQPVVTYTGHLSPVLALTWRDDGARLLTVAADQSLYLWQRDGKLLTKLSSDGKLVQVEFSADGKYIFVANEQKIMVYDADGKPLRTFSDKGVLFNDVLFSPDNKRLVAASFDGVGRIWDVETGQLTTFSTNDKSAIQHAAIAPGGQRIVTAHSDGTVRLWDGSGQYLATLSKLQGGDITALAISPDGGRALAVSVNGEAQQYLIRSDDLLKVAACRVGRALIADEIARFNVGTPQFDFSKRQCPPPLAGQP